MRTFEELERLWSDAPARPVGRGTVTLVVLRTGDGNHETPDRAELDPVKGLVGDRWADKEHDTLGEQITLINATVATLLCGGDKPLHLSGDNFVVDMDLSVESLPVGAQVKLGEALLEVTPDPHTGCKKFRERFGADALRWVNYKPNRSSRLRGVHLRVLEAGAVALGDVIEVVTNA
jgi:MOSC domain-containing protein YiiM